jgi:inactivated superfamily I helicase
MALRNAFEDLALESTHQALRLAVAALTRTIGLMTPDVAGRMRVTLESAPGVVAASQSGTWNLSTLTTCSTLTNQSQVGGYGANDQIPALMHLSADSLRRNITVN